MERGVALFRFPIVVKRHTQAKIGDHYDMYFPLPEPRVIRQLLQRYNIQPNNTLTLAGDKLLRNNAYLRRCIRAFVIRYWPEHLGESHLCILTKYTIALEKLMFEGMISPPKPGYGRYTIVLQGYIYFWMYMLHPKVIFEFSIEPIRQQMQSKFEGTYILMPDAKYIRTLPLRTANEFSLQKLHEGKLRMYRVRDRAKLYEQLVP